MTEETLLALLERKKFIELRMNLVEGSTTFEELLVLSKDDWKTYFGLDGIHVYYHLHPQGITSVSFLIKCLYLFFFYDLFHLFNHHQALSVFFH